jgi:hypothetical protein
MVEYVIDALRDSPLINKISAVGPSDLLKKHLGDKVDYYMKKGNTLFDKCKGRHGTLLSMTRRYLS